LAAQAIALKPHFPVPGQMVMKALLTLTAVVEAGAGLALLGFPSETASLLLGCRSIARGPESGARWWRGGAGAGYRLLAGAA
jgi:hypothetical protein